MNSSTPDNSPEACCTRHELERVPEVVTRRVSLAQLRTGETGRVLTSELDPQDAAVLRAMGLRADAQVKLCRPGQPCIVSVVGVHGMCCRIGLASPLAERVMVGLNT